MSTNRIPPVGTTNVYFNERKVQTEKKQNTGAKYDSASFSSAPKGDEAFKMEMISRISQQVRTSTTTADIKALKESIASGEYTPDPMAIAGRILCMPEDE